MAQSLQHRTMKMIKQRKYKARKKKEPASRLRISECLPVQPSPAFSANGRSRTGAESTKGLKFSEAHCS